MKKEISTIQQWYKAIVKERNKRLDDRKTNGDYNSTVAYGLTEALSGIYDKVLDKNLKAENWDSNFLEDEVIELCLKYNKSFDSFNKFMEGQTIALNDQEDSLYFGCDVKRFMTGFGLVD